MKRVRRHSLAVGATISLLLHGAVLWRLRPIGQSRRPPPLAGPLVVELLPWAPASPAAAPPALPAPPAPPMAGAGPAAAAPPAPPQPAPQPAPRAAPLAAPAPTGQAEPPAEGSPGQDPRAWFEANGLAAAARPGGPDLGARLGSATPGPGRGAPAGTGDPLAGATSQARLDAMLAEAGGQDRVRHGFHPSWSPLAERLRAAFEPDLSLFEHGPRPGALARSGLARLLPSYLRLARRFASAQRLTDEDGTMGERASEAGRVVDRLAAAASMSPGGLVSPAGRALNPFRQEHVALVEVTHREDGAVTGVRLRRSCGLAPVDRLAVAATRRALLEGAWRPAAGLARRSIWAFTASLVVIPPAPTLACPLDVLWTGRLDRCAYPLEQAVEGRVELQALE